MDLKGGGSLDTACLLQTLVKATLANPQANRDLSGALSDVILKDSPEAEIVAAEGRRYSELVCGTATISSGRRLARS